MGMVDVCFVILASRNSTISEFVNDKTTATKVLQQPEG